MPVMNNTSAELREWAARCEDNAAATSDDKERASLLRKCEALRALADQEDWLAGQPAATGAAGQIFSASNKQQAAE
jgi:hypothetical protein